MGKLDSTCTGPPPLHPPPLAVDAIQQLANRTLFHHPAPEPVAQALHGLLPEQHGLPRERGAVHVRSRVARRQPRQKRPHARGFEHLAQLLRPLPEERQVTQEARAVAVQVGIKKNNKTVTIFSLDRFKG
jgi:hypothetical protein